MRIYLIASILFAAVLTVAQAAEVPSLDGGYAALRDGDYAAAYRQWRPLAEEGDRDAQGALGSLFHNGQGVPQDFRQALAWYRRAAEQGSVLAQNNLGLLYVNGQGVPRDLTRGHMWFNVAAAGGSGEARETAIKNRDLFAAQMTPQQIEQAQAMAWRCQQSKFKDCD